MRFLKEHKAAILISLFTGILILILTPLLKLLGEFLVQTFVLISERFSNNFYMNIARNDPHIFAARANMLLILVVSYILLGVAIYMEVYKTKLELDLQEVESSDKELVGLQENVEETKSDGVEKLEIEKNSIEGRYKRAKRNTFIFFSISFIVVVFSYAEYAYDTVVTSENIKFRNDIVKIKPYVSEADVILFEAKWTGMKNKTDYKLIKDDIEVIKKKNNIE